MAAEILSSQPSPSSQGEVCFRHDADPGAFLPLPPGEGTKYLPL